eukprot:6816176-Pyramimonas_sp.AAC.1
MNSYYPSPTGIGLPAILWKKTLCARSLINDQQFLRLLCNRGDEMYARALRAHARNVETPFVS